MWPGLAELSNENCRHSFWPYIEGVSEPTYSQKELDDMKGENHKFTFEGKEYDGYSSTQMQRRVEREIRKQKRFKTAFEAAGLSDAAAAAGSKLRALNEKYRAFSKASGLPEQRERMRVQYVDDASYAKAEKLLEKSSRSGILKDTGYQGVPITEEAIQRVPLVQPDGWSIEQAERLQTAHRDLLRAVMDKPVGTEAGAVYTPDMRLIERKIGKEHQISIPQYAEPYVFIHNHPSGLTFSISDIENFGTRFDLEIMTAVGNDGTIYFLQKIAEYSPAGFSKALLMEQQKLQKLQTPQEYAEEINWFLEGAAQYGIRFISRR